MRQFTLSYLPNRLAICRLDANLEIPSWADIRAPFISVTRTQDELSIVCNEDSVPAGELAERGWRAFKVEGQIDLEMTGIISTLTAPLANAQISVFSLSTFDTDYILVKEKDLEKAISVFSEFCKIKSLI